MKAGCSARPAATRCAAACCRPTRSTATTASAAGLCADQLDGGEGDDMLRGGLGQDTFVFAASSGKDIIVDFRAGQDTIEFIGLDLETFDEILAAMVDSEDGVVIQLDDSGDNSLLLEGVTMARLDADDFSII